MSLAPASPGWRSWTGWFTRSADSSRSLAGGIDREHLVPGRVPGGVLEPQLRRVISNVLSESSMTPAALERFEGGCEDLPVLLVGRVGHQLPVGSVDDVASVREGRRRRFGDVPPEVVVVDMADQHELDRGRKSTPASASSVGRLPAIPVQACAGAEAGPIPVSRRKVRPSERTT